MAGQAVQKINKNIEIVVSSERSFGSMRPALCRSIQQILLQTYEDVRVTEVSKVKDLESIVSRNPDLVFLGASRLSNESTKEIVWMSRFLEDRGIACTGSGSEAHNLERNKDLSKNKVLSHGYSSASFIKVGRENGRKVILHDLKYPLFVKPLNKGGGIGIDDDSYITNYHELESKVQSISNIHWSDSLVEEYLAGREFTVAILYDESKNDYLAMPIELVSAKNENGSSMLSNRVKLADAEKVSKVSDADLHEYISNQALGMFKAIGGRDYGRIDMRLDDDGVAHFMEANLFPSLTEGYGSFPKACLMNAGLSYLNMINAIANLGLKRSTRRA